MILFVTGRNSAASLSKLPRIEITTLPSGVDCGRVGCEWTNCGFSGNITNTKGGGDEVEAFLDEENVL